MRLAISDYFQTIIADLEEKARKTEFNTGA